MVLRQVIGRYLDDQAIRTVCVSSVSSWFILAAHEMKPMCEFSKEAL